MTNKNTGNKNTGNCNTGNCNSGNRNTGNRNTGNCNTGNRNSGYWNSGNCNSGNRNSGYWNTGDYNTGFFNTTTPESVTVFNSHETDREYFLEAVPAWLFEVNPVVSTPWGAATDEQRKTHPEAETTGLVIEKVDMHTAYRTAWENSDRDVEAVRAMPGFDYDVWLEITGVELDADPTPPVPETIVVDGRTYRLEL